MTLSLANTRPNTTVARFGNSHGYRLDGDLAHLNAEILCDESALTGQEWALQLWANDDIKIAELPVGLLQPNGSGLIQLSGTATVLPPAGAGEYTLSLALVSGTAGHFDSLEDSTAFGQTVSFVQPRLRGDASCEFSGDAISLKLDAIENPRPADNLSGTLALEIWSLDTPYAGGDWRGQPVASIVLGCLNGQSEWTDCHFTAHAAPLPADGHLTLMLREWTPAGYVTRDYRALPVSVAVKTAAPAAEPVVVAVKPAKVAAKTKKAAAEPKAKPAAAEKPARSKASGVSVNTASEADLAAVKGLSAGLAGKIIAARPYAALDELVKAKGMGPKLLAKVRESLSL